MFKNREGKEVDAFEGQIEIFISNLRYRLSAAPDDVYTEGQLSAYNYALALYREHKEADPE